jgi:hypothetical protein
MALTPTTSSSFGTCPTKLPLAAPNIERPLKRQRTSNSHVHRLGNNTAKSKRMPTELKPLQGSVEEARRALNDNASLSARERLLVALAVDHVAGMAKMVETCYQIGDDSAGECTGESTGDIMKEGSEDVSEDVSEDNTDDLPSRPIRISRNEVFNFDHHDTTPCIDTQSHKFSSQIADLDPRFQCIGEDGVTDGGERSGEEMDADRTEVRYDSGSQNKDEVEEESKVGDVDNYEHPGS